jgi:hypothetical protein
MRKPHQFRFQVFHRWLTEHYPPCKVADIGGGKGLLSFLLNQSCYQATVIDPIWQPLEWKYKDISSGKRVKLSSDQLNSVPHIQSVFSAEVSENYDLLVGLHAHGSNIFILQAAAKFKKDFAILPCCVIDEPIIKKPGINWFNSLVDYAAELGLNPQVDTLNFVGQSKVIYKGKV